MTHETPERPARRRWPWSSTTPLAADIAACVLFLIIEVVVYGWAMFGYGLEGLSAQGAREMDESTLAGLAFTQHFLIGVLVVLGYAALSRAPWTALLQLLVAGFLVVLLVAGQHEYDQLHPDPAPTPSAGHVPCYSGSGRCD
ncbi:DUF6234 family protein [Streptomyces sp. NPDC005775]|uniref:DUF6234 family protein n=1 Tax=Streptomyces sp. NPDC005775 TaxID=3364729 RepID=UPI0036AEFC9D